MLNHGESLIIWWILNGIFHGIFPLVNKHIAMENGPFITHDLPI